MLTSASGSMYRVSGWARQISAEFGSMLLHTLRLVGTSRGREIPGDCADAARISAQARLKSLAGCGDAASLRSAVRELCAEFGKVARVDIMMVADAGKRRAMCLLRLESEAQETRLMSSLGASRFGDDVLVVVDLLPVVVDPPK